MSKSKALKQSERLTALLKHEEEAHIKYETETNAEFERLKSLTQDQLIDIIFSLRATNSKLNQDVIDAEETIKSYVEYAFYFTKPIHSNNEYDYGSPEYAFKYI